MLLLNRDREQSTLNSQASESHPSPSIGMVPQDKLDGSYHSFQANSARLPSLTEAITIIPGYQATFQEADVVLQLYTSDFVPQFPFVPLPTHNEYDLSTGRAGSFPHIFRVSCPRSNMRLRSLSLATTDLTQGCPVSWVGHHGSSLCVTLKTAAKSGQTLTSTRRTYCLCSSFRLGKSPSRWKRHLEKRAS